MVVAWLTDPAIIGNSLGMGILLGCVFAAAAGLYALRNRPLRYTGDVSILGSLVLIDVALFFTRLHSHPGLLGPFFVWVGFASPLWFPRRRAILYVVLAFVASGIVIVVAGNASAVAGWVITTVTLVVAFFITSFLSDALVSRERLAIVGEMASVVGHDLRNPLGAVANSLFLLHHSLDNEITEKQEGYFQIADREIAKASAILGDLRAYVRPGQPHLVPVDLADLVAEVLEVLPVSPGTAVTVDVPHLVIAADSGQLAQIVTNLISNAYEATGADGVTRIRGSIEGRHVVIEVEDDGPGIEGESLERVFEPFYTTKPEGTGLGLAIVRRLVEGHGGSIDIDSGPGSGTRFVVRLPQRLVPMAHNLVHGNGSR